ncbi:flavoprotein [Crossiella sp. CA198]|uniref:flavoprotein n=1 Tax=Crossiella sp. CA198 TaxID=3455607 RepID=UPI003F8D7415
MTEDRPRRVLLVLTGSIMAAFMPTWISLLRTELHCVLQVLLTGSAAGFVSPQALSALTGRPVAGPDWRADQSRGAEHVLLAQWAEIVVVAPATMNFCAKLATGISDDLASTTVHSTAAPTVLLPALPAGSVRKPVTRRVLRTLAEDGHVVLQGPAISATTGEEEDGGPGTIDDLIRALITLGVKPAS